MKGETKIYKNDIKPIEGLDMNNILNKRLFELEKLEIKASEVSKKYQAMMVKLGQVKRKGAKPMDPRNSPSGKAMIKAITEVKAFQKKHFNIISEPGIIAPTVTLIRATIKLMQEAKELPNQRK